MISVFELFFGSIDLIFTGTKCRNYFENQASGNHIGPFYSTNLFMDCSELSYL